MSTYIRINNDEYYYDDNDNNIININCNSDNIDVIQTNNKNNKDIEYDESARKGCFILFVLSLIAFMVINIILIINYPITWFVGFSSLIIGLIL